MIFSRLCMLAPPSKVYFQQNSIKKKNLCPWLYFGYENFIRCFMVKIILFIRWHIGSTNLNITADKYTLTPAVVNQRPKLCSEYLGLVLPFRVNRLEPRIISKSFIYFFTSWFSTSFTLLIDWLILRYCLMIFPHAKIILGFNEVEQARVVATT